MVNQPIKYIPNWLIISSICSVAAVLAHLDLIDNGPGFPKNYQFPFSSFAINAFYIVFGFFCFHALVEFLDRKQPWQPNVRNRFISQLAISTAVYLAIQCAIVYYIEPTFNEYASTPVRIWVTFLIGFLVVLGINLCYLIAYLKHQKDTLQETETINLTDFLQGTLKGKKVLLPIDRFVIFQIQAGVVFGVTEEKSKVVLKESLADLEKQLAKTQYFRINRKQIIGRAAIQKVEYTTEGTGSIVSDFVAEPLLVSRRRTPAFRKWVYQKSHN